MLLKAAEQQHQYKNSKNARFNQKSDMKTAQVGNSQQQRTRQKPRAERNRKQNDTKIAHLEILISQKFATLNKTA